MSLTFNQEKVAEACRSVLASKKLYSEKASEFVALIRSLSVNEGGVFDELKPALDNIIKGIENAEAKLSKMEKSVNERLEKSGQTFASSAIQAEIESIAKKIRVSDDSKAK